MKRDVIVAAGTSIATASLLLAAAIHPSVQGQTRTLASIKPPFTFKVHTVGPDAGPQSGVKVRCLHPREERGGALVDMVRVSDATGVAEFNVSMGDVRKDRYYWFSVVDDRFASTPAVGISPVDAEFETTFRIAPTEAFRFRVVDEKDGRVSGAKLSLVTAHDAPLYSVATTNTGPDGEATIRFARLKTDVIVVAPNYAPVCATGATLSASQPLEVKLEPGLTISGRVADDQGKGLENVRVLARNLGHATRYEEFMLKSATGTGGEFSISHAPRGDYEVWALFEDSSRALFAEPVRVRARVDTGAPVVIQAKAGAVLRGRFVTQDKVRMSERAIYVGTFGARRMAWDTQTGKDGSFAVHIPSDAQGAVNFVGLAGYCQEIVVPQGIPSLRVEEQGIRFRRVPPGVYEGIEVRFSLMGVADVRVAGPAGKAAGEVALVVHPTERIYRAARPGKFRIEIPPNQDARIEVRDKSGKQSLLTTEPFRVKEGELIEKHLVLPKR